MARCDTHIKSYVKSFRLARGWSQDQLAERIGVRRQAIYDIESGRYLPNTVVALRLARHFDCRVEDIFVDEAPPKEQPITIVGNREGAAPRVSVVKVRGRLVGFPLGGRRAMSHGFCAADALVTGDGGHARLLCSSQDLDATVLLMGCDPAFEMLNAHVARLSPNARVVCRFASSRQALERLAAGHAHIAGTHLHNTGGVEANVAMAGSMLGGYHGKIVGFSLMEEGLMIARGNPMDIRSVADLGRPEVRLVNREPGAALRVLLDDHLASAGFSGSMITGYDREVSTHSEGAHMVACNVADAALGLRAVAVAFGLDFVPITAVRCDLVIPADLMEHPTVKIMMDVLQSRVFSEDLRGIPGYESLPTGKIIAEF